MLNQFAHDDLFERYNDACEAVHEAARTEPNSERHHACWDELESIRREFEERRLTWLILEH